MKWLDPIFQSALIQRMLKNTAYLFSANGISVVLSLIQGIFIARMLGVENFGVWGTITLFTGVVNNIASFRIDELVIKYVGKFTEANDTLRASAVFKAAALTEILSSVIAYGLIWLLAPLGANYLAKDSSLTPWFLIYGLVVLFNLIFESANGLLRIFDHFKPIALLNVIQSLITLVLTVMVFAVNEWFVEPWAEFWQSFAVTWSFLNVPLPSLSPLMAVILIYMVSKLVGAIAMTGLAFQEAARHWGKAWWQAPLSALNGHIQELARFAISTNLSATINLINKDSELLWVAYFRNPLEVGYYKLALGLINIVHIPVSPMPSATYPELSREVARNRWDNVRMLLKQGSLVAGGYTLLASLGVIAFGQPFIRIAYTPQYLPAYPALLILMLGFLFANTLYWQRVALLAFGLPHFLTKINFYAALLKIIGYIVLVPRFGYLGCAGLLAAYHVFSSLVNAFKSIETLHQLEISPEAKSPYPKKVS